MNEKEGKREKRERKTEKERERKRKRKRKINRRRLTSSSLASTSIRCAMSSLLAMTDDPPSEKLDELCISVVPLVETVPLRWCFSFARRTRARRCASFTLSFKPVDSAPNSRASIAKFKITLQISCTKKHTMQ